MIDLKAPGKLILIGEYVVLEGAPALVCAVDRHARVTLEEVSGDFLVDAPVIGVREIPFTIKDNKLRYTGVMLDEQKEKLHFFTTTFENAWNYLKIKNKNPFRITIDTESFYSRKLKTKLGFGSSAALTVVIVKALYTYAGKNIENKKIKNEIFRLSLKAHKKSQQNMGSGIDIAASSYGGVLEYKVGNDKSGKSLLPVALDHWQDMPLLVIYCGASESTRKMVFGVTQLKKQKPKVYSELMDELQATALEGINAYKTRNIYAFMNAAKTYYAQMNLLGKNSKIPIISDVHQKIARIVHQNAGAYKPSGAGSGDIGIALAESQEKIRFIRKQIEAAGFECIDVKVVKSN